MAPIKAAPTEGHQNTTEYFARSRFARWASLSSAISGSKGERCKSSSRKATTASPRGSTAPPAAKGAGFLDFVGPNSEQHDASHSLSGGRIEEFSCLIFLIGQRLAPWGIHFPYFLVFICVQ